MALNTIATKTIVVLSLIAFLWFGAFGLAYSLNLMSMGNNGGMNPCPFSNQGSMCTMDFTQHINIWQSMFNVLPKKMVVMDSMISVTAVFVLFFVAELLFKRYSFLLYRYKYYLKNIAHVPLFDYLLMAFSDGRIHSKIYA